VKQQTERVIASKSSAFSMIENMHELNTSTIEDNMDTTKKRWTQKASDVDYEELKQKLRGDQTFQKNTAAYDGGHRKSKVKTEQLSGGLAQRAMAKRADTND